MDVWIFSFVLYQLRKKAGDLSVLAKPGGAIIETGWCSAGVIWISARCLEEEFIPRTDVMGRRIITRRKRFRPIVAACFDGLFSYAVISGDLN